MKHSVYLALAITLTLSSVAFTQSQKLQDFQAAAKETRNCLTIPYGDLQSQCKDRGQEVNNWCKGGQGPTACERNVTVEITKSTVAEYKNIERLESVRRDFKDKRDSTKDSAAQSTLNDQIVATEREIENAKRRVDDLKRSTSNRKDLVEKTMYTIDKCIDYRRASMNIFAAALDKVRSEDDPQIKPFAVELKGKYQDEKEGHEMQIKEKENAKNACKDERP